MRILRNVLIIAFCCGTLFFPSAKGYATDLVVSRAEDLFASVAYLQGQHITNPKIDNNVFGTGFFVSDNTGVFLVTAEHIAKKLQYNTFITVHGPGDVAQRFKIEELVKMENVWTYHGEADVAVARLNPSRPLQLQIRPIKDDVLLSDFESFNKLRPVTTIGFPLGLGKKDIAGKFSPITRTSKVASGQFQFERFDTKTPSTFVVLEDPSVAGFSGSPVIALTTIDLVVTTLPSGPLQCIGLVHGTLYDQTGGKFAAIVPARFILDTIKKAKLIK